VDSDSRDSVPGLDHSNSRGLQEGSSQGSGDRTLSRRYSRGQNLAGDPVLNSFPEDPGNRAPAVPDSSSGANSSLDRSRMSAVARQVRRCPGRRSSLLVAAFPVSRSLLRRNRALVGRLVSSSVL
jgi:hypothetical protein